MNDRGQIGKWVAFVFLGIVAIGMIAVYLVSSSPENFKAGTPPILETQYATGEFGERSDDSQGLRRVVLTVKSNSPTVTDLNNISIKIWVNTVPADMNKIGLYKVRNILNYEKRTIERFDVIEFDIEVADLLIPRNAKLEFGFVDANVGAYSSDAGFIVPETKDRFEKLLH